MPRTNGSSWTPDMVGLEPWTICRYCGIVIMPPNMPAPMTKPPDSEMTMMRFLKIFSGMSAWSPARRSAQMNAARPTTPMTYARIELVDVQPHVRPCSATRSSGTTPMTSVAAPSQSMTAWRLMWCRCSVAVTAMSAKMPTGMLMRKTQRQPVMPTTVGASEKNPPMIGPKTDDVPNTARKYPWYLARSRGGTMSVSYTHLRAHETVLDLVCRLLLEK